MLISILLKLNFCSRKLSLLLLMKNFIVIHVYGIFYCCFIWFCYFVI